MLRRAFVGLGATCTKNADGTGKLTCHVDADLVAITAACNNVHYMGSGCRHGVAAGAVQQEMSRALVVVHAKHVACYVERVAR
jgi:hypothetical protein